MNLIFQAVVCGFVWPAIEEQYDVKKKVAKAYRRMEAPRSPVFLAAQRQRMRALRARRNQAAAAQAIPILDVAASPILDVE